MKIFLKIKESRSTCWPPLLNKRYFCCCCCCSYHHFSSERPTTWRHGVEIVIFTRYPSYPFGVPRVKTYNFVNYVCARAFAIWPCDCFRRSRRWWKHFLWNGVEDRLTRGWHFIYSIRTFAYVFSTHTRMKDWRTIVYVCAGVQLDVIIYALNSISNRVIFVRIDVK